MLQYNMRITQIVDLARKKSSTTVNSFPNEDMVLYMTAKIPQFQADIEDTNEDYMGSIEYRDLIATGTGTHTVEGEEVLTREYNLPTDMINRLQNVYAKLDGTNWIWLKEYNEEDLRLPFEEDNILEILSNEENVAGYFIFRGSLFLLSGEIEEDVEKGLKLWNFAYSGLFSEIPVASSEDDRDMVYYGIPSQLHETLAVALSYEWKCNQATPVPLTAEEQKYYAIYNNQDRFKNLRGLNRGKDMSFSRPADGYDNGFNL